MQIETFLVDLDGVVLHRADFFSNRVKTLYPNANHDAIKEFFVGGSYKRTALGEVGLVKAITEVFPSWNVDVSVAELIKTWFDDENDIDQGVLNKVQELRKSGIKCVIATDHSKYRKNDVWNNLCMSNNFDEIIASSDVGATKEETAFYTKAMEILNIADVSKVTFTDDDTKNVVVAESLGIKGIVYTGLDSLSTI